MCNYSAFYTSSIRVYAQFSQVLNYILGTCLATGQTIGDSGDTKFTEINYRMEHSSVLCDIIGLIQGTICAVCSCSFSILTPESDLSREEMVSDPNESSPCTSSVVRRVGHEKRGLLYYSYPISISLQLF